jgi:DNA anti-recombination protein RmuC
MRKQLDTFSQHFDKIGSHLKNAQQSYNEADKRFERASNTLDNVLSSGEAGQLEYDDAQGTLALSPPTTAKKSA